MEEKKRETTSRPRLVIVSERTRYHFQKPLEYAKKIEIIHLYRYTFSDMDASKIKGSFVRFTNVFNLYNKLKKLNPDLVQGLEPYYGYSRFKIPLRVWPILFTTFFYCAIYKKKYFFHVLENLSPVKKYGKLFAPILLYVAKKYAQKACFIFYLNKGAKKNLEQMGIDRGKMLFGLWGIWGVDINVFKPVEQIEKNIIFVGRMVPEKGPDDLIRAFGLISSKHPDFRLSLIGTGEMTDDLMNLVEQLQLKGRVEFLGEVPSHKIAEYIKKSYILVSPSKEGPHSLEQVGVVNIEAMSCGVPVVSNKSGSIGEYVVDGFTGLLVAEGDVQGLSHSIDRLVSNPTLRKQMSQESRRVAVERFDARANVLFLEQEILARAGIKI